MKVRGNTVKFNFKGKSGVYHELDTTHPLVAKIIKKCIELPGYELFQYQDQEQGKSTIDSRDVNEYLQTIAGENMSAKDFRTWGGTTIAGITLYELGEPNSEGEARAFLSQAYDEVADNLGNTIPVCKQYYIHPKIVESYENGTLIPHFDKIYKSNEKSPRRMSLGEYAAWTLLGEVVNVKLK